MRKLWFAGILAAGALTLCAQDDPPSRVARLNFLEGSVSLQPAGHDDWTAAAPNYPLTIGDRLWADDGARAELHIGSTGIRLSQHTAVAFLNLDDRMTQVRLSAGTINVTIRHLEDDESYEIDTPNSAVSLLRPGAYRIDADPDQQVTTVTVRGGDAEVTAAGAALPVHAQQSALITGADQPQTQVNPAGPPDDFDHWWMDRDNAFARRPPPRYVSPNMAGYEDLDQNGYWRDVPGYGPVWFPNTVAAGWAPYHNGHWVWVDPWGWTWVDDAPWGFAPFHYGRWAFVGGVWGWVPGPVYARPVYAPALVAWVGGAGFGAGLSFGVGGGVAWVALGPREPFIPSYHVSNVYVNRVNMVEVTHINVTNVTNITYVNRTVPGAVVAVSRTDFAAARPVARVAVVVPPHMAASATVTTREIPVTRQQALAVRPAAPPVAVVHPPQNVLRAPVVTKTAPPPATAALARPAGGYRAPAANQPASVNRPAAASAPAYKPAPAAQPTQSRPAVQSTPAYKPPAQSNEAQRPPAQAAPSYRPPAAQPVPANKPAAEKPSETYRPPAKSEPAAKPQAEKPKPEPKPKGKEKEKEKEK
jgi:hypothetical protein